MLTAKTGKAAGKTSATGGQGHTLPRSRITAEKFGGTVANWKGKYGWITPAETIAHDKAQAHNGSLFASMDDVTGGERLAMGTPVAFHIYEDENGLGAEEVEATGDAPPDAGKGYGKYGGKKGQFNSAKGSFGGARPFAPAAGKGFAPAWQSKGAKGFGKGKGKTDSKGKRGQGHTLARTRITAEKFMGTVESWKGKYGWVTPAEEVPHEKAAKNNGKLFVSMDNIEGSAELTPGASVEFHIWEDSTGLGAEEVVQY